MPDDYEVGYKKPPKEHQFKPGQSGNPKGRPKGPRKCVRSSMEMYREFMAVMEQNVTVNRNGRQRKMPAICALYEQILAKALGGDFRAMKLLSEFYRNYILADEDQRMSLFETLVEFEAAREREAMVEAERRWRQGSRLE